MHSFSQKAAMFRLPSWRFRCGLACYIGGFKGKTNPSRLACKSWYQKRLPDPKDGRLAQRANFRPNTTATCRAGYQRSYIREMPTMNV
jgi:hypothetical protein